MMTDRELLELAAKAAGIKALWSPDGLLRNCTNGHPAQNIYSAPPWNPLTDDGDALRLVVKLNLPIVRSKITDARLPVVACYKVYVDVHEEEWWQWEFLEDDPYAATRRAIVHAAAEIGKEKK